MRVFSRPQRLLPDAAMARPHQRTELEIRARSILRRQSHVRFDHRHLALLHHQHPHQLDAHQKRIQRVRAVEQRVVLQSDLARRCRGTPENPDSCCAGCSCCRAALRSLRRRSRRLSPSPRCPRNPPSRLAMSPDGSGSPSYVVTMPTMSIDACRPGRAAAAESAPAPVAPGAVRTPRASVLVLPARIRIPARSATRTPGSS